MRVPFVDLKAQYLAHKAEFDAAMQKVVDETAFIGGGYVKKFEEEYARAFGVKHCISVANGTDAIYIPMKMLGIGEGDEVITTAASWISTSETISQTGARPVFVDCDDYSNIDVDLVAKAITPRTKAVIPVHLYGQAAEVDRLAKLCAERGLHLIEDCAQSHLAERRGKLAGTTGIVGTFSFYPGKNLGAYGDAGAIVTNDDALARKMRMYANHGALVKHEHEMEGINSRLDGMQAALLSAKLPHLAGWTEGRRRAARLYDEKLAGIPQVVTPKVREGSTHVYHLYVIRAKDREGLRKHLVSREIEVGIHYPVPMPLMKAYAYLGMKAADVPKASANADSILSLPIYPEISEAQIEHVAASVREFYRGA